MEESCHLVWQLSGVIAAQQKVKSLIGMFTIGLYRLIRLPCTQIKSYSNDLIINPHS